MQGKTEVDVEVWDYDTIGGNDLIGVASIDVWNLMILLLLIIYFILLIYIVLIYLYFIVI